MNEINTENTDDKNLDQIGEKAPGLQRHDSNGGFGRWLGIRRRRKSRGEGSTPARKEGARVYKEAREEVRKW